MLAAVHMLQSMYTGQTEDVRAKEMAQLLQTPAALSKDPGLVPSTYMMAVLNFSSRESDALS